RASFAGLAIAQPRGAIVRAVLEGVAFGLRDVLDAVAASGERPSSGRISGGGARGDLWPAIVAAALELPLTRLAIEDGAALGAAMLGGVAASLWADVGEAAAAVVALGETIEPDPAWVAAYEPAREHFRAL